MNSLMMTVLAVLALKIFFLGAAFAADKMAVRVATSTNTSPQPREVGVFREVIDSQ